MLLTMKEKVASGSCGSGNFYFLEKFKLFPFMSEISSLLQYFYDLIIHHNSFCFESDSIVIVSDYMYSLLCIAINSENGL